MVWDKILNSDKSSFWRFFFTAVALMMAVALFGPAMILIGSPAYPVAVASWLFLVAIVLVFATFVSTVLMLLPGRVSTSADIVLRSAFLVIFVILVFFPEGGRQLDGVAGETLSRRELFTLYAGYGVALLATCVFFWRYASNANFLFNLAAGFTVAIPLYVFVVQPIPAEKVEETSYHFELGHERNIVFILADMLQGSTFEQQVGRNPESVRALTGFSAYTRATSPFPFTNFGLPAILSGKLYALESPPNHIANLEAAQQDSLVTDAIQAGYQANIVGFDQLRIDPDQMDLVSSTDPLRESLLLLDLSMTRISKQVGVVTSRDEGLRMLIGLKRESVEAGKAFAESAIGEQSKVLTVIHNFIPHSPVYFSAGDLLSQYVDWQPKVLTVEGFFDELDFFLDDLSGQLQHLKDLGIYKDSLIIVVGDHGHFVSDRTRLYDVPGSEDFKGYEKGGWARNAAMYNPAVLIKPAGVDSGELSISRDSFNLLQLRDVVQAHLAGSTKVLPSEGLNPNVVVVFKDDATNPYTSIQDHHILEFQGNASDLVDAFVEGFNWFDYAAGTVAKPPNHLLEGSWYKEEGKGAWLGDRPGFARLNLQGIEKGRQYELRFVATPLLGKNHPMQRVKAYVGDEYLGEMVFETANQEIALEIPKNVTDQKQPKLDLRLVPLDARSPKELNLWNTTSPVSVYFYSMTLAAR